MKNINKSINAEFFCARLDLNFTEACELVCRSSLNFLFFL